jgi:hypothetical protein
MEFAADQAELFPWVEKELASKPRSFVGELRDAQERHGPLIPRSWIQVYLDVSRQRVKVLIDEGKLETLEMRGKQFVPLISIEKWLSGERKAGRPVNELTMRESFARHVKPLLKKARK